LNKLLDEVDKLATESVNNTVETKASGLFDKLPEYVEEAAEKVKDEVDKLETTGTRNGLIGEAYNVKKFSKNANIQIALQEARTQIVEVAEKAIDTVTKTSNESSDLITCLNVFAETAREMMSELTKGLK